jgi:hypothetical protein
LGFFGVPVFPSSLTPLANGRFGTIFHQEPDDPVARNANLAKKNEINAATKDISGSPFLRATAAENFRKKPVAECRIRATFFPRVRRADLGQNTFQNLEKLKRGI